MSVGFKQDCLDLLAHKILLHPVLIVVGHRTVFQDKSSQLSDWLR